MVKFTLRERLACIILAALKHNREEFIICKRNDFIFFICEKVLKVDYDTLMRKVFENAGLEYTD